MIKTYRLVKSTREALREKYACEKDDDEYHLKGVRHRRRIANDIKYHHSRYDMSPMQTSHKHQKYTTPAFRHGRRRALRKRKINSTSESSSDSDYYYDKNDRIHSKKLPTSCCNQYHCAAAVHTNYTPLSMKRAYKIYDSRPCKRESDCRCCNERKLCQEYRHVTDTSTEEWYVENCCSPKRSLETSSSQTKLKKPTIAKTDTAQSLSENPKESKKIKKKIKSKDTEKVKKTEGKPKTTKTKNNSSKVSNTESDESFKRELKMALEASKELYEKEKKIQSSKDTTATKEKYTKIMTIPLGKTNTKPEEIYDQNKKTTRKRQNSKNASNIDDKYDCSEKIIKIIANNGDDENDEVVFVKEEFIEPKPTALKNSTTMKANNSTITASEETFFASIQSKAICNSTAMSTASQAYNTQFAASSASQQDKKSTKQKDKLASKLKSFTTLKKNAAFSTISINNIETKKKSANTAVTSTIVDNNNAEISKDLVFIKPKLMDMRTTKTNNSTITTSEKKVFASIPNKNTCNSTTLSDVSRACDKKLDESLCQQNELTKHEESEIKHIKRSILKDKKTSASSSVSSTTIRAADPTTTLITTKSETVYEISSFDEPNDCTLVTSTTNIEPTPPPIIKQEMVDTRQHEQKQHTTLMPNVSQTQKGILIYTPHNRSLAPAHSFTHDGYFTITKEHLSTIIGERATYKFLKYYIGRKRFNSNSTIYFRPPRTGLIDNSNISSSSESDDDLDNLGLYGDLYESRNN